MSKYLTANQIVVALPVKKPGLIIGADGQVTPLAWGGFALLLAGVIGYGIRSAFGK